MELKFCPYRQEGGAETCFNRTFMELKCRAKYIASYSSSRFNRTFMELKLVCVSNVSSLIMSFNRTFMELK